MSLYAKLWTDILGDPKLLSATAYGAKNLVVLPWLLAFAKEADDDGRLSINGEAADPRIIAHLLPGVSHRQVSACMAELEEIDVLVRDDDGVLRFAAWEHRSGTMPSDTPAARRDRVARHRAKKRGRNDVTVTSGNDQPVTTSNETEKEREKELEKKTEEEVAVTTVTPSVSQSAVAKRLTTDSARKALAALLAVVPDPDAWLAEISVALDGMHGRAVTPAQLEQAMRDFLGNGAAKNPNMSHFRGYLRRAGLPPRASSRGSAPVDEGDGARRHRVGQVDGRRHGSRDGDAWWGRMQREAKAQGATKGSDVYDYAFQHLDEPANMHAPAGVNGGP